MFASWLTAAVLATAVGYAVDEPTAADRITLPDDSIVLGQAREAANFGALVFWVRREWARENVPKALIKWEYDEALAVREARRQRKLRLIEWRRDRSKGSFAGNDPITPWIDREINQLSSLRIPVTPLISVTLQRNEVRAVARRSERDARLLRLGWLEGIEDVESMPVNDLKDDLRGRGRLEPGVSASVERLLPLYLESEAQWRRRRAVTEVAMEPGLRFVQFRELVLTEQETGEPSPRNQYELFDTPTVYTVFRSINGLRPVDPLQENLDAVAARGRIGAVYSKLNPSVLEDQFQATTTFYVRDEKGQWSAVTTQRGEAQRDEPADTVTPRYSSPPIRSTVQVLEAYTTNVPSAEVSRDRRIGAEASERALARARAALDRELAPQVLPIRPERSAVSSAQRKRAPR